MNRKQLAVIGLITGVIFTLCGCDGFRFAATEAQKDNAWLHQEVCASAANMAQDENTSAQLCGLTELAHQQSAAFVIDYGLPETVPALSNAQAVVISAKADAARRPDMWTLADGALEFGIAIAGLIGGVYGIKVGGYLKTARDKSKALREIIRGNELFKRLYPEQSDRFKEAQRKQSPVTRQLVTEVRAGAA
ncbi:MAG: hypothetical protein H8E62_09415 [Planctomycetes bacterium]|nr:hypothetical protein [Planctomycetota bacterium]